MKKRVKVNNKFAIEGDKLILIGLKDDKTVTLHFAGELGIEDCLDMLNTVTMEVMTTFKQLAPKEVADLEVRKQIHERAVWGFSLMMDRFYPEGKEDKFMGMTEEAIMRAQDDLLSKRVK